MYFCNLSWIDTIKFGVIVICSTGTYIGCWQPWGVWHWNETEDDTKVLGKICSLFDCLFWAVSSILVHSGGNNTIYFSPDTGIINHGPHGTYHVPSDVIWTKSAFTVSVGFDVNPISSFTDYYVHSNTSFPPASSPWFMAIWPTSFRFFSSFRQKQPNFQWRAWLSSKRRSYLDLARSIRLSVRQIL